ncbi:MAG: hypothetical protein EOO61_02345 [Hymenobacter sp.]|nr:MAG: hypothetical protein EOO61_02345 [Hymenobacter sp.]
MSTEDILNLIADIKHDVEEQDALEEAIAQAERKLESDKDDLIDLKDAIVRNREKLDELIDEATGQNEDDSRSGGYNSVSYGF